MTTLSSLYSQAGDQYLLWLAGLALACAVGLAFAKKKPLLCLPSLAWIFLSVLPFCLLSPFFPLEASRPQAFGLGAIGLCLAASDIFLILRIRTTLPPLAGFRGQPLPMTPATRRLIVVLALFTIIVPLIHLFLSNEIPFIHKLFGRWGSEKELVWSREYFSKLLNTPYFLKIFFQWTFVVIGPLLILILYLHKRLYAAAAAFLWVAVYSVLSLARFPLVVLMTMCAMGLLFRLTPTRKAAVVGAAIVVMSIWCFMASQRTQTLMAWQATLGADLMQTVPELISVQRNDIPLSPGDVSRLTISPELSPPDTFGEFLDNLLYRTLLTPMEVSNRWFLYYARHPETQGAKAVIPFLREPGWRHPANVVGVWAYTERFPGHYQTSISAYASMDADAFGHLGYVGLSIACAVLLLMRLAGGMLYVDDPTGNALLAFEVGQMVLFPFLASVQAILLPQGFLLLLFLQAVWKWAHRR